jgi:hypothetical protein
MSNEQEVSTSSQGHSMMSSIHSNKEASLQLALLNRLSNLGTRWEISKSHRSEALNTCLEVLRDPEATKADRLRAADVMLKMEAQNQADLKMLVDAQLMGEQKPEKEVIVILPTNGTEAGRIEMGAAEGGDMETQAGEEGGDMETQAGEEGAHEKTRPHA